MRSTLFLVLSIAFAAGASASVVVRAVGATGVTDIGTKVYRFSVGSANHQCPNTVQHGKANLSPKLPRFEGFGIEGQMLFSEIKVNGVQCSTGRFQNASLVLLSQDELLRVNKAIQNFLKLVPEQSRKIFLAGIDSEPRQCGGYRASDVGYYGYTKDIGKLRPLIERFGVQFPTKDVFSGEKWMISYNPSQGALCLYIDVSNPSIMGTPVPEETGEASPGAGSGTSTGAGSGTGQPGTGTTTPTGPSTAAGESPAPEPSPTPICFPSSATVELEGGARKEMKDVQIGDRVKVASGAYSDVFMFTHKLANVVNRFVTIKTATGEELSLTHGHYLYVNGALASANTVRVGDLVETESGPVPVTSVSSSQLSGLFNPQTVHGDIIVNGIRASTYTTAVNPSVAHALLTPIRVIYNRLGWTMTALDSGSDVLANYAPSGPALMA